MYSLTKRAFDILVAAVGLTLLSPVLFYISLRIKLESEGPVLYRGTRVGKDGLAFEIFKFRSMVINADKIGGPSTSEDDPRLTKIGKFIRKYKLDEVPQLINVLQGQMSLVGPRPEVVSEVKLYRPEWHEVFEVRPGITDLASIEFRNEGEIIASSGIADAHEAYRQLIQPKKLALQKEYVRNRSLLLDAQIVLKTVAAVVKG